MFVHLANTKKTFMSVHLANMPLYMANTEEPLCLYSWRTQKKVYVCTPGKHKRTFCVYTWKTQKNLYGSQLINTEEPLCLHIWQTEKKNYDWTSGKHWRTFVSVHLAISTYGNLRESACLYFWQQCRNVYICLSGNDKITYMPLHLATREEHSSICLYTSQQQRKYMSVHLANEKILHVCTSRKSNKKVLNIY